MDELEAIERDTHRYRDTEAAHEESRRAVTASVLAALRAGQKPTAVAAASPFSEIYVRKLARENGIPDYVLRRFPRARDPAGALRAARLIPPGTLPTRERYARYGLDIARAWHQQNRDDQALQALIQAERHGPEDIRRPSVRALIRTIATAPRPPAGAREFATRTGSLP